MRPSRFTPIFTRITDPEVGPVAISTSARFITSLTGLWPAFRESTAASGSR